MRKVKGFIIAAFASVLLFGSIILTITVVIAVVSIFGQEQQKQEEVSLEGLPPFITKEMVMALLEMQDEYGHPVSTGLAQIIAESGFGAYGPGGNDGMGLSRLAYNQKNLFGIKYFSGDTYAQGAMSYQTGEQTASGAGYTITAGFSVYASYTDCIKQRAWMLERSPYIDHIREWKKTKDIPYGTANADGFMNGIRKAGWATDISYVEHCTSLMRQYNLYRFDNMTLEQYEAGEGQAESGDTGGGEEYQAASKKQKEIVDTAYRTSFCGDGLCATWISRVFAAAGQPYPYGNANSFAMSRETGGLKVGMVIATQHFGADFDSWNYGHIGIYIGDGKVMHNESSRTGNSSNGCTITPLDQWKQRYEYQCSAYYGWVNQIDLTK